jgi:hypothetical protein
MIWEFKDGVAGCLGRTRRMCVFEFTNQFCVGCQFYGRIKIITCLFISRCMYLKACDY